MYEYAAYFIYHIESGHDMLLDHLRACVFLLIMRLYFKLWVALLFMSIQGGHCLGPLLFSILNDSLNPRSKIALGKRIDLTGCI